MKKYIVVFLCSAILIAGFSYIKSNYSKKEYVSVISPVRVSVDDFVETIGKINVKNSTNLFSKSGIISKLNYKVGDYIKKGDTVAEVLYVDNSDEIIANYSEYKVENVNIDELKKIGNAKKQNIVSSVDGYITQQSVPEGSIITKEMPIIVISDFKELEVSTEISENKISIIKEGQNVLITGDGFKDRIYTGKIIRISPLAKQKTLSGYNNITVDVAISISNSDEMLRPGNSVNAKILINSFENSLVLPYESVRIDENDNSYVYVINNGKIEKKAITIANESSVGVVITSGISESDIIVNNAPDDLINKKIAPEIISKKAS